VDAGGIIGIYIERDRGCFTIFLAIPLPKFQEGANKGTNSQKGNKKKRKEQKPTSTDSRGSQ
jgi:hypothetical protein